MPKRTICRASRFRCAATCSNRRRATNCGCFDRHSRDFMSFSTNGGDRRANRRLAIRPCFVPLLQHRCSTAASSAPAQVHQSPLVDPKVAALRDAALNGDHYAWDITEGLTTEVGPRLAGTEAEARARDWAVKKLTAMGFANVRVEPFDMPVWVRGPRKRRDFRPLPAADGSRRARQQRVDRSRRGHGRNRRLRQRRCASRRAGRAGPRQDRVRRSSQCRANQDGSGYGQFGAPRRQGPTLASKKGALAIVVRSIGTDHHRNPHTGVMTFDNGAKPIPAGALSNPDADQLAPHPEARPAGPDEAGAGKPEPRHPPVRQCHCRSAWPRPIAAADPGQRPSRQLGPGHRRDRRCDGRRHRRRRRKADHGCRAPASHHPDRLVRRRRSRAVRRPRLSRARTARNRITR